MYAHISIYLFARADFIPSVVGEAFETARSRWRRGLQGASISALTDPHIYIYIYIYITIYTYVYIYYISIYTCVIYIYRDMCTYIIYVHICVHTYEG